jgi:hypothetical protein
MVHSAHRSIRPPIHIDLCGLVLLPHLPEAEAHPMNHADRQRLSRLLDTIEVLDAAIFTPGESGRYLMPKRAQAWMDVRAIVDSPTPPEQRTIPGFNPQIHSGTRTGIAYRESEIGKHFLKTNDAEFWDEPAHQRLERIWNERNQAERTRRHRILAGALTTLTALTLAMALSADAPPDPGPSHQPTPQNRLTAPSPTAQDHIRATLPTRTEGTGQ